MFRTHSMALDLPSGFFQRFLCLNPGLLMTLCFKCVYLSTSRIRPYLTCQIDQQCIIHQTHHKVLLIANNVLSLKSLAPVHPRLLDKSDIDFGLILSFKSLTWHSDKKTSLFIIPYHLIAPSLCVFCSDIGTEKHLFWNCTRKQSIWQTMISRFLVVLLSLNYEYIENLHLCTLLMLLGLSIGFQVLIVCIALLF